MLGGAGGAVMSFGSRVFSSIIGAVVGVIAVAVGLVALAFFIPMAVQGQKAGVETGNAIVSNSNIAIGAATESFKTSKQDRQYGAALQRAAAAKHLKEQKKA